MIIGSSIISWIYSTFFLKSWSCVSTYKLRKYSDSCKHKLSMAHRQIRWTNFGDWCRKRGWFLRRSVILKNRPQNLLLLILKAGVQGKCKGFQHSSGSHRPVLRWAVSASPGNRQKCKFSGPSLDLQTGPSNLCFNLCFIQVVLIIHLNVWEVLYEFLKV